MSGVDVDVERGVPKTPSRFVGGVTAAVLLWSHKKQDREVRDGMGWDGAYGRRWDG